MAQLRVLVGLLRPRRFSGFSGSGVGYCGSASSCSGTLVVVVVVVLHDLLEPRDQLLEHHFHDSGQPIIIMMTKLQLAAARPHPLRVVQALRVSHKPGQDYVSFATMVQRCSIAVLQCAAGAIGVPELFAARAASSLAEGSNKESSAAALADSASLSGGPKVEAAAAAAGTAGAAGHGGTAPLLRTLPLRSAAAARRLRIIRLSL